MVVNVKNKTETVTIETIIKKFEEDEVCYETKESEISKFYSGKCVFLTGGTGFLGKLLVEKLLRACPDIAGVFMLVRAKKGKDAHTRMDEIFSDTIYQKLSKLQPKFRHKIVLVNGDVSLPGLGMSIEDREIIMEKVSIFIHSAATVKFHEKLNLAIDINVKGTKEMLALAKECRRVDSFVHISTVFSHCYRQDIDEKLYDVPYDTDRIIQLCNATPPQLLEKITPDLLGDWPNTYVFTKAIAEDCLKKFSTQFPICIMRPAIVVATYKEPIKSWIDNIYGATGIVVGTGVGILRVANVNKKMNAEIVPADVVINCTIAASYKTAVERKSKIPVYNYISSTQNGLSWERFMYLNIYYGTMAPSLKCLWIYTLELLSNKYWYHFCKILFHIIPAFFMDIGLALMGKTPQMLKVYKKVHNFSETIAYFTARNWTFENNNTQNLFNWLSEPDKKLFFFDMSKVNWEEYFTTHCLGLRTFIIKDEISTIPQSRKRYFRLQIAHYILQILGIAILLRLVYALLSYLFL